MDKEYTLETLIDRYGITAGFTLIESRTDNLMPFDGPKYSRPMHFAYTLSADHGGITGNYSVGIGHLTSYSFRVPPTVNYVGHLERERLKYKPSTKSLVCSLLLDASIDPELTFREWCYDYAIDMHPADALDTFNALRDTRAKMQRIFLSKFDLAVNLAMEE
jgi:hypothetical protein